MQIEIISVVRDEIPSKNGKGTYGQLTVSYLSGGKIQQPKKLISFSNPAVFKAIEKLTKGATIDVTTVKNDKGYWDWIGINEGGATQVAAQSTPNATRVTGSNYETKEERAIRQRYIIRQSSISSAVDSLAVGAKSPLNPADVIALARKYEEYVFEQPNLAELQEGLNALEDDVPY